MEKIFALLFMVTLPLIGTLLLPATAHSDECIGLYKQAPDRPDASFKDKLKLIAADLSSACGSSLTVANQVLGKDKGGHLKLEDDKPFNLPQAEANLALALKDPAVQEALTAARPQITDESDWLYYQATVFDTEGYYDARNLLVRQLQQQLGIKTK